MINSKKADVIIDGILESPNETKSIEFKPSIAWPKNIEDIKNNNKIQETIKSILAMSNSYDGGKIILGITKDDQGKYTLEGMLAEHLETYDHDLIFDHVRNYGKPEPKFQTLSIEYNNLIFIVFIVESFTFTPVICNNNRKLDKLEHTCIYIRNDKPETKKITDPSEMKTIVDIAIEKELHLFSSRIMKVLNKVPKLLDIKDDSDKFNIENADVKKL